MKKFLIGLSSLVIFLNLLQAKTVVIVERGSGTFIGENKIITKNHVIRNATDVVILVEGKRVNAKVIKLDSVVDLALLKVEGKYKYAHLRLSPKLGEQVYIVAGVGEYEDIVCFGRVAGITQEFLLIDATIIPGFSGGGVYDKRGKLLGIVDSSYGSIRLGDFLMRATPAKTIKQFLEE